MCDGQNHSGDICDFDRNCCQTGGHAYNCRDCQHLAQTESTEKWLGIPLGTLEYQLGRRLNGLKSAGVPQVEGLQAYYAWINRDGKCYVCRQGCNDDDAVFDHDDENKIFRGIAHQGCNKGMGYFCHNPQWLRAAACYIEQNDIVAWMAA